MATRRPLVHIQGFIEELPQGDTIAGAPSSGGGGGDTVATGTATLDFGTDSNEASVAVTGQGDILTSSFVNAVVSAEDSGTHTANDAAYAALFIALSVQEPVAGVGFTIQARSLYSLSGTFKIRWVWR